MRTHSLSTFTLIVLLLASPAAGQRTAADAENLGGARLAATRRAAISAKPFGRPLDAEMVRRWLRISSRCTIAEFELFLGPLSADEKRLLEVIEQMPAPIVNRTHFEDLRAVLKNGRLTSYLVQEQQEQQLKHTTPAVENELYGAFDCVFASVGPPDGSPRYGDVIIRLRDSVREHAWATPFSGMHFLHSVRDQDARRMQQVLQSGRALPTAPTNPLSLGFDDRLHFSHYVVTENDWSRALGFQAVLTLRNAGDSPAGDQVRRRFARLLSAADAREFWTVFIPPIEDGLPAEQEAARVPFGYLEGKFDNTLPIADFTAIEVPNDKLNEVLAWPEARPYRDLIRGY
ncbi:hypothetical protein KOR34_00060 [Posidoniimonas corsicana]|uniref:DUF5117 domain-containing protein n=1 Tax=Posidoniimonas corsicana TaxID=1938618 RepID=A0A5C5VBA8_9BACT|nr:hypothetical protein [Posidoniimonas corsicana]TWT35119.1 hypothetical protein KOR34_00060 [Posidoniimonas corsicana]